MLAIVTALCVAGWIALAHGNRDVLGKPLGTDFVSFWSAARLAAGGSADLAYDPAAHAAAQAVTFGAGLDYYAFFYPPPFLLLCLPLAALPFLPALVLWLAATIAPLYVGLRRLLPQRWAVLPILAFPGILVNAGYGQNGFLSAACLGWAMLLMQSRPLLAGTCLGLLIVKPHLLIVAPIALLAARRFRMLAAAAGTALALSALSFLVLGAGAWQGFWRISPLARAALEQGLVAPWKMQSAFAAIRVLHGGLPLAFAVQAAIALAACAILVRIVARRPGAPTEGALMIAATPLCTPFLLSYDLVCIALPLAWVTAEAQRGGWRPWEKIVLLAAYALPLLAPLLAGAGLPLAPLILAALFAIVARRAYAASASGQGQRDRPKPS